MAVELLIDRRAEVNGDKQDITRNLPSLTFESALDEEEVQLLHLRQQSHAHTTIACASAAFFVAVLNEARQIRADLCKTSKQRRAIQLLTADSLPRDPLLIGIIGCGRLGTYIAKCLLAFSDVKPVELFISTRRPDTLGELKNRGVHVVYNNVDIASRVHLLFLCLLPSQVAAVIEEIKQSLAKRTVVYCLVNSMTPKKLQRTLGTTNFIIPEFVFSNNPALSKDWNSCISIAQALEREDVTLKCCPLSSISKDTCVHLTEKWAELTICAFSNMCMELGLTTDAALDLMHGVLLGIESRADINLPLVETDFVINWKHQDVAQQFPIFDLCKIHGKDSHVLKKIQSSTELRDAFIKKFQTIFRNFVQWKKYNDNGQ